MVKLIDQGSHLIDYLDFLGNLKLKFSRLNNFLENKDKVEQYLVLENKMVIYHFYIVLVPNGKISFFEIFAN